MSQQEIDLQGPDDGDKPKVGSYAHTVDAVITAVEPLARLNSKTVVATALAEAGRHFGVKLQEAPSKPKGGRD